MVENASPIQENAPQLSVHIMLPEAVDRRLERWTNKLAGASWPAWGGHVTLVPNFVERGEAGGTLATLTAMCGEEKPFQIRLGAPIAVPDATRPDYYAVFLTVDSTDGDEIREQEKARAETAAAQERSETDDERQSATQDDTAANPVANGAVADDATGERTDTEEAEDSPPLSYLYALRERILDALRPVRQDVRPQLLEQRFLPHITLALGLGELEANQLVRDIRANVPSVAFRVEVVWLVTQTFGEGARFDRQPIPLGRIPSAVIMRD